MPKRMKGERTKQDSLKRVLTEMLNDWDRYYHELSRYCEHFAESIPLRQNGEPVTKDPGEDQHFTPYIKTFQKAFSTLPHSFRTAIGNAPLRPPALPRAEAPIVYDEDAARFYIEHRPTCAGQPGQFWNLFSAEYTRVRERLLLLRDNPELATGQSTGQTRKEAQEKAGQPTKLISPTWSITRDRTLVTLMAGKRKVDLPPWLTAGVALLAERKRQRVTYREFETECKCDAQNWRRKLNLELRARGYAPDSLVITVKGQGYQLADDVILVGYGEAGLRSGDQERLNKETEGN